MLWKALTIMCRVFGQVDIFTSGGDGAQRYSIVSPSAGADDTVELSPTSTSHSWDATLDNEFAAANDLSTKATEERIYTLMQYIRYSSGQHAITSCSARAGDADIPVMCFQCTQP